MTEEIPHGPAMLVMSTEDVLDIVSVGLNDFLNTDEYAATHIELNGDSSRIFFRKKNALTA